MDFNFVTPRLATGAGISSQEDVSALVAAGVTYVVDCRAELDDAPFFAGASTIHYLWNPTQDDGTPKPPAWFQKSIDFALANLVDPKTKIYAHCAAGINRGPSTCYAIMRALGWSPSNTEAAIRAVRPQVGLRYKADADAAILALGY